MAREHGPTSQVAGANEAQSTEPSEAVAWDLVDLLQTVLKLDRSASAALRLLPLHQARDALAKALHDENPSRIVQLHYRSHRPQEEDRPLDHKVLQAIETLPPEQAQQLFKKLPKSMNPNAFVMGWIRRYRQEEQQQNPSESWWNYWP